MSRLVLVLALLAPGLLLAQLQLYEAPPGTTDELPVGSLHQFGTAEVGGR